MEKRILGVSWLDGQFRAVAFQKGSATGRWSCPRRVETVANFTAALKEAVQQTGYLGLNVTVALAHRRLAQQHIETPPIHGRDLELFVERRAYQLKTFEEDPIISFHPTLPTKAANGLSVSLLPRPFLLELVEACKSAELHLLNLFSTPALLQTQLPELPLPVGDIGLLAAETEGFTTFAIGRKDGEICLARTLWTNWEENPERITAELNRSVLFVKQQFNLLVNSVWLFGPGAEQQAQLLRGQVDVPVRASPVKSSDFYWIEQAVRLPSRVSDNFITPEMQKAPQRKIFLTVTAALVTIWVVICLVIFFSIELTLRRELKNLQSLQKREEGLLAESRKLEQMRLERKRQEQFLAALEAPSTEWAPPMFMSYLAEALPAELVLHQLRLRAADSMWQARLEGELETDPATASRASMAGALLLLESRLERGPFRMRVARSSSQDLDRAGAESSRRPAAPPVGRAPFYLEGVMK